MSYNKCDLLSRNLNVTQHPSVIPQSEYWLFVNISYNPNTCRLTQFLCEWYIYRKPFPLSDLYVYLWKTCITDSIWKRTVARPKIVFTWSVSTIHICVLLGNWTINHFEICSMARSKEANTISSVISTFSECGMCRYFAQRITFSCCCFKTSQLIDKIFFEYKHIMWYPR